MASTTPNTIVLKGEPLAVEAVAAGTITPGHLIYLDTAGKFAVHNVAAGVCVPMFAREHEYDGGGIADTYLVNETVYGSIGESGDEFYAFLATANNAAIGSILESNGDGTFRLTTHAVTSATTAAAWPVAVALEALNNASGSAQRIKVRVL
jgi:hypothetical protein